MDDQETPVATLAVKQPAYGNMKYGRADRNRGHPGGPARAACRGTHMWYISTIRVRALMRKKTSLWRAY